MSIQRYEQFDAALANTTIGYHFDEPIISVIIDDLGEGVGLMSSIARAQLIFESGEAKSVVVKCVARTANRELSKGLNFYNNEINFYKQLAIECPISVPRCLFAEVDALTQDFLLVLEDLSSAASGDQLSGCDEAELRIAFERAAQLHARFWGRTSEFEWIQYQINMKTMLFRRDSIFRPGVQTALERYPQRFSKDRLDIVHKVIEQYLSLFCQALGGEPTVIHGDYRIDNMFLRRGDNDDEVDIIAYDWQNTMGGNGVHDIAYFSQGGCDAHLRGDIEMRALRHYWDVLVSEGVRSLSFDQCLEAYRYNLLISLITPIAIAGTLDQGNERGARLADTLLERGFAAVESMECADLLR
ncbi:MAG: ecdysteroid 22-kinase family protein [Pseudomonadaceae bacterium]|nr:ecdysteroid 22-kinase family protein [Pseudomonadaceae bacterium]